MVAFALLCWYFLGCACLLPRKALHLFLHGNHPFAKGTVFTVLGMERTFGVQIDHRPQQLRMFFLQNVYVLVN